MRTIGIANQKGGTAKTTTAVNLAATLAEKKKRVLLLDLDPQASTTSWYGVREPSRGLFDAFTGNGSFADIVRKTDVNGVDLIPGSPWLAAAEKALATEVGAETILRRALESLPAGRWDFVLLDCPPSLGILTVNALTAVREVLIPVEAHVMALEGVAQLFQTIEVVRERLNPALKVCGILACRVDARTRHALDVVEELRRRFGTLVYKGTIRENVRIAECPSFWRPITLYAPSSQGAKDYRALANEVLKNKGVDVHVAA